MLVIEKTTYHPLFESNVPEEQYRKHLKDSGYEAITRFVMPHNMDKELANTLPESIEVWVKANKVVFLLEDER